MTLQILPPTSFSDGSFTIDPSALLEPSASPPPSSVMLYDIPIPVAVIDELPYFSAEAICRALELPFQRTLETQVAQAHRCVVTQSADTVGASADFISPIGVWSLALKRLGVLGTQLQIWVFRETKAIRSNAFDRNVHGDAQKMALLPSGDVPPRPSPRSGRLSEWQALHDSDAHQTYKAAIRRARLQAVRLANNSRIIAVP